MFKTAYKHFKNILPCISFAILTGVVSAIIVTLFKIAAEFTIRLSTAIYGAIRENPIFLPVLILATALVGFAASLVLSFSNSCRGGGIPTSVAAIRGIVSFNWLRSLIIMPVSALLTFLCGLPLGTEGPCVQIGTSVGDGVIKCFGNKKHNGWRRYIMTGGASAGFSVATASPITAVIFSMEELHKHFSPLLLTVASISVTTAQITVRIFAAFGLGSFVMFDLSAIPSIPLKLIFAPLLIGLFAGVGSILFTHLYHAIDGFMHSVLKRISSKIVLPLLFACISVIGFFLSDALGSGHSLVVSLFNVGTVWYLLLITLFVRAICMTVSNTSGATGGVFLPTLAFGAIIGALIGKGMIALGWLAEEHYVLTVVLGISAFLGATSRIPLTASVFAIETMGGISNVLPIIIATTVAFVIAEISGLEDFTDTVINAKIKKITKGKEPLTVVTALTVRQDSFVVGKDLGDVLWPNSCAIISFERAEMNDNTPFVEEGDVITVRYSTYNPSATIKELEELVGLQSDEVRKNAILGRHSASLSSATKPQ